MDKPFQVVPDIVVLPAHFSIPGLGYLPVNAFVIKAQEPVLVDAGMGMDSDDFMAALESVIDPKDLRWFWITHDDADHTGSIQKVLEAAPRARLVAYSLAALRMSTAWPIPMHRFYWLNPGEIINVGDRNLIAVRPPLFDNPTTIGIYDDKSDALFSADCFGAIISSPARNVEDLAYEELVQGMITWATGDSPWVHMVEPSVFNRALNNIRQMAPKNVFSGHLPPALGKTEQFLDWIAGVPASPSFVAPNQSALEQILAQNDV